MAPTRRGCARVVLQVVLTLALLEGLGWLLGPRAPDPTSQEGRSARFNAAFYEPDPELMQRIKPGITFEFGDFNESYDASCRINSAGFRGEEFAPPDEQAFRIAVFGDSVTFGYCIREPDAWPSQLERMLRARAGPRPVQLRNYAVPGYSALQSRILLERHALRGDFRPHLVLFASGFNDGYLRPVADATAQGAARVEHGRGIGTLLRLAKQSRFVRLFTDRARPPATERVPRERLVAELAAVADACAGAGIALVLVDSCLPHTYPRAPFTEVADARGVPLVSFHEVLARRLGIATTPWPKAGSVRVELPTHGVEVPPSGDGRPPFYLLLLRDPARRLQSERHALHDDGQGGDRTANDGIWSVTVAVAAGPAPDFVAILPGLRKHLPAMVDDATALNSSHFRQLAWAEGTADAETQLLQLPPAWWDNPWKHWVLDPDPIHPNAEGSGILAEAVREAVVALAAWRAFAGR